jgi:hypothetical protein
MNTKHRFLVVAVCLGLNAGWLAGCRRPQQTAPVASASSPSSAAKLAKIVFVGKEHPCDCTRKAIDAGWAALQKALASSKQVPVQRLQVDTEAARVEPYRAQKPIMALPAIYFVDGTEAVLDLLQGEVDEAKILPLLKEL